MIGDNGELGWNVHEKEKRKRKLMTKVETISTLNKHRNNQKDNT